MALIARKRRSAGKTAGLKRLNPELGGTGCGKPELEAALGELAVRAVGAQTALQRQMRTSGGGSRDNPELPRIVTEMVCDYHVMVEGVSERLRSLQETLQKLSDRG